MECLGLVCWIWGQSVSNFPATLGSEQRKNPFRWKSARPKQRERSKLRRVVAWLGVTLSSKFRNGLLACCLTSSASCMCWIVASKFVRIRNFSVIRGRFWSAPPPLPSEARDLSWLRDPARCSLRRHIFLAVDQNRIGPRFSIFKKWSFNFCWSLMLGWLLSYIYGKRRYWYLITKFVSTNILK